MTTRTLIGAALTVGVLALAAEAASRSAPVEHFTARAVEATSLTRISLRPVEIAVTRWSTDVEHRMLEAALLEKGLVAFLDRLCNFAPAGAINTIAGREFTVRYAWQAFDRDGGRRIFLAADEPIVLAGSLFRRPPTDEPLTFLELRMDRNGDGEGKLSEATRLSVDESRNLIEMRDYANRPLHLIEVRSLRPVED
jgi:hypothetical protein